MTGILKKLFGKKFPDTRKYEAAQNQIRADYIRFQDIEKSSLWHRYQELDREIHSGSFEKKVSDLKHKKFKDTEQYQKLKRYNELKNSRDIKTYLKFIKAGKGKKIQDILASEEYNRFLELEKFLNTPEFYKAKSEADFKNSEAYRTYREYKKLRKNSAVKWAIKTAKTESFAIYKRLENSKRISEFFELKTLIESKEFIDFKYYMEDRNRFKKSDEAALLNEFAELRKHKDIVWFLRTKSEKPFEDLKKWKVTFEDDFDSASMDSDKWITGYYWGKALMNETYSLEGEKQFFSDSNVEVRDSSLRITTRKETVQGKTWNPVWGFHEKTFDFTSGLISTGQSFRQQYGRFEAKVRFSQVFPVMNAFWLVGERITPHIDIFKTMYPGGRLLEAGLITDVPDKGLTETTTRIKGARFTNDFYIYSLDWSEKELVWKINGVEVYRQTHNIPKEPMYLTFSSTLPQDPNDKNLPANMEVNWVRCYSRS